MHVHLLDYYNKIVVEDKVFALVGGHKLVAGAFGALFAAAALF
jgi:hypothetical protein